MKGIQQTDINDCGVACLTSVMSYYGTRVEMPFIKMFHPFKLTPYSFFELAWIADKFEFDSTGYECDRITEVEFPAIAHLNSMLVPHYVVVKCKLGEDNLSIIDPYHGKEVSMSIAAFEKNWSGKVLILRPGMGFRNLSYPSKLSPLYKFLINRKVMIVALVGFCLVALIAKLLVT